VDSRPRMSEAVRIIDSMIDEHTTLVSRPACWVEGVDASFPFTLGQAREAGLTPNRLTGLVRAGVLRRLLKGVYVAERVPDSLSLRVAALRLVVPVDGVIVDRTAGWLHGADVLAPGSHETIPQVAVYLDRHRRLRNDVAESGHRSLRRDDVMEVGGLRVTTPIRTAWDLGRLLRGDQAFAAAEALLHLQVFSKDEFLAGIESFRGMRGVVQLRQLAPLTDHRAESPPESILRLRWLESQLPTPQPQLWVVSGSGELLGRLDIGNEEHRLYAEYDGAAWHRSDEDRARDTLRRGRIDDDGWRGEVFVDTDLFGRRADPWSKLRRLIDPRVRRTA
jgi:hypothetical protein